MNRADLALLLISAIWGTTFALLRDATRTLHPADVTALRFSLATLALGVVYAKRLWPVRRRWLLDGFWIGVWLAAGYITQVMGLRSISASRSAFITSMSVVIVPFIAYLLLRARPAIGEALGILLATLGLVLFSSDAGFTPRAGDLWTVGCAFAFAMQIVITGIVSRRSPAIPLSVAQVAVGAAAGWTFVAARGGLSVPAREIPWGVLLYLAVVATALILVLQTWALARTSAVKAAVIYATEPVFAALFASAFFSERMTPRELLGAALILFGVLSSELWRPAAKWASRIRAKKGFREASGQS